MACKDGACSSDKNSFICSEILTSSQELNTLAENEKFIDDQYDEHVDNKNSRLSRNEENMLLDVSANSGNAATTGISQEFVDCNLAGSTVEGERRKFIAYLLENYVPKSKRKIPDELLKKLENGEGKNF